MNGILNMLKPPGMTSHDMVSVVRRKLGIKKVGHTGTLDPNAAGVLPICVGQATKISQFLLDSNKKYRAELTLGITTDTQDIYGDIIDERELNASEDQIIKVISTFQGELQQVPPMYSALKIGGKKLYEIAREGKEVERASRKITIHQLEILRINKNKIMMDVTCSKGTYIRTLCNDIGEALGCGGTMSFLLRTATGNFDINTAITIEDLMELEKDDIQLYPVDFPLVDLPKVLIDSFQKKAALNGNKIRLEDTSANIKLENNQTVRAYIEDVFIGIATVHQINDRDGFIKFNRLFV
ncbi:tRNA pseudouridine(55) synthase TruB [Alkaliphilus serpentinus]|uniref:tRNA pseudouridine synthase B n=1 Tax=Alkaliphilus serpentinus TaxID=1482731 RepID=A0A833HPT6_9FIRM|nr:tRNA pseudouridine(55) synthase TruB [Alkaliphilus serpentinus]KAB3531335.1 tRNA pseudouridine(55) synthase TruB [Alkaliphilus serpentinus]